MSQGCRTTTSTLGAWHFTAPAFSKSCPDASCKMVRQDAGECIPSGLGDFWPISMLRAIYITCTPEWAPSPGFGCRIRTEPASDPNPNPQKPIRSGSEPRVPGLIRIRTPSTGTDPNPNRECRNRSESELGGENRIRTPNPDQTPPNVSHLYCHEISLAL